VEQGSLNPAGDRVSPSGGRPFSSVSERFEAAWKSASSQDARPRIQDFLNAVQGPARTSVLGDLLATELKLREQAGERPLAEEYCAQFPEAVELIQSTFERRSGTHPRRPPTSLTPGENGATGRFTPDLPHTVDLHVPVRADRSLHGQAANGASSVNSTNWLGSILVTPAPALPAVPGYDLLRELGRGGMGIVYEARHVPLQRLVALKMILPGREFNLGMTERFLAEAAVVARFSHPNLVQIFDVGKCDGMPYLSLELLEGGSLSKKLGGAPLPAREAAALLETLALAAEYAHQKGFVHLDLKPSNVLLTADGAPKIADFGLAKRLSAAGAADDTGIMGTPSYMAPEQAAAGRGEIGPAADIYALGSILYEFLTGRPPFRTADKWQTIEMLKSQEPLPPRSMVPQMPRDLELICLKCLKKDPQERFGSARELAEELRRFQEGRPIQTRPAPLWERAWKWSRRRPAAAALIAVSIVALCSFLLYLDQGRRVARRELSDQQRTLSMRDKVLQLSAQAQQAADRGDLPEARGSLEAALKILETETIPDAEKLKAPLTSLHEALGRLEADQKGRLEADTAYTQFSKLREKALLANGLASTGVELPTNLKAAKDACREALAKFGLADGPAGGPIYPPFLSADRQEKCTTACYELLLIWAESEAQTEDGSAATPAQVAKAIETLDRVKALAAPLTGAYHLRRAAWLESLGRGKEAVAERELAATADLKALDYFLIGDSLQKRERLTEAAAAFKQALQMQPDHFWAHYFLAICSLRLQQPAPAWANLNFCLSQRDDLAWLYLLRGIANGQLQAFHAADADFAQALQRSSDEQTRYGALFNRGYFRMREAQLVERSVAATLAQPLPVPLRASLEFAYRGAGESYRQERLASAAALLDEAIRVQPSHYAAHRYLAAVRRQQRRLDLAVALAGQAIELTKERGPQLRAALFGERARLYREAKNDGAALADLDQALLLYPNFEDALERGKVLQRRGGRFGEAVGAYDAAIGMHASNAWRPEDADVFRFKADALLHLRRQDSDEFMRRHWDQEALKALGQYLDHNGRPSAEIYRVRGDICVRLRQYKPALNEYSHALELGPDPLSYRERGWVHLLAFEELRSARDDFGEAIRLNAHDADAYAGRALAQARQGLLDGARRDVKEAEKEAENGQRSFRLFLNIAHVHAQLAALASGDRARYANRAFEALEKAFQCVSDKKDRRAYWRDFIGPDGLLNPIREMKRFKELEEVHGKETPVLTTK
jgi:eukaryotic-like serine/threonine-protein kinase